MDVINIAQEHFQGMKQKSMTVPQWKDENNKPVEIFYKPVSFKKMDEIHALQEGAGSGEFNVCSLIVLALNQDGSQMFKRVHRVELLEKVSASVIGRIALRLTSSTSFEEAEKNS